MEPICQNMQGPAVEDVQTRLARLGYTIDGTEVSGKTFGPDTARAVRAFRADQNLVPGDSVDLTAWSALVDATYKMGDRTLYLRLPNFHGNDVLELQHALNILGFACGGEDGYFGPHTEAALQQFQENVGLFADGMAFQDTFSYLDRLRHVWEGKPSGSHSGAHTGFARAASVLERVKIAVIGEDPIARNIASRMWNIATATTEESGLVLCDDEAPDDVDMVLTISDSPRPKDASPQPTIVLSECENLSKRLHTACAASAASPARIRIALAGMTRYNGTFKTSDAQTLAVRLLDAVCDALAD